MKNIELKAVMSLVQREREQYKKLLKRLNLIPTIEEHKALMHFRNILRQLTDWAEDAKEGKGPISSDSGSVYILWIKDYYDVPRIYGIHRTRVGAEKERDEMISEHSYLALYLEVEEGILED